MAHLIRQSRRSAVRAVGVVALTALLATPQSQAQSSAADIAVSGGENLLTVHAEGAQIYECQYGHGSPPEWVFREPIAILLDETGKTIGRHYGGPTWEQGDGSSVTGRVTATTPGALSSDIPWLRLVVVSRRGEGSLAQATTVQRINTHGGKLNGICSDVGAVRGEPYSADYVFIRN